MSPAIPSPASDAPVSAVGEGDPVPLVQVERELVRRVKALQSPGEAPVLRACMSNLLIYCDRHDLAETVAAAVPTVVSFHPARVLLLLADAQEKGNELSARVTVRAHAVGAGRKLCSEQVTLHATGASVHRLPFAVRGLLVGDLPTNLWWATPQPPPLGGVLFHDLAENVEQVVYDSIGWPEPARGVAATAAWLAQLERSLSPGCWRVASDLNWRRLKYWRRLLTQALDPATAPGFLEHITEVALEHGPHAVIQAWELVSWLAARLGWRVRAGRVQPGVEIAWNFEGGHGKVRVRLRRLEQGPPTLRNLLLTSAPNGKVGRLRLAAEDENRLAVMPEGTVAPRETEAASRTVTVPPQPVSELVGRQLSDRERDSVFLESMAVARVLAESV